MERFIQVEGVGTVEAVPDTFIVNLTIITRNVEYDTVISDINKKSDELVAIISNLVSDEKIKISSFFVDTDYQNRENNGIWESVPVGYIARETIKVEIPADLRLLQDVMNAAMYSNSNPEISVLLSLSNKDIYVNKAIVNAINNAYTTSSLISNTIGIKIQNIKSVEYKSSNNFGIMQRQYTELGTNLSNVRNISLEPIIVEERVLITYSI